MTYSSMQKTYTEQCEVARHKDHDSWLQISAKKGYVKRCGGIVLFTEMDWCRRVNVAVGY